MSKRRLGAYGDYLRVVNVNVDANHDIAAEHGIQSALNYRVVPRE